MPMVMLPTLWEVGGGLACMYFDAFTELYLSGAHLSPLLTFPWQPETFQQLT